MITGIQVLDSCEHKRRQDRHQMTMRGSTRTHSNLARRLCIPFLTYFTKMVALRRLAVFAALSTTVSAALDSTRFLWYNKPTIDWGRGSLPIGMVAWEGRSSASSAISWPSMRTPSGAARCRTAPRTMLRGPWPSPGHVHRGQDHRGCGLGPLTDERRY
jgi:hypothetical protein